MLDFFLCFYFLLFLISFRGLLLLIVYLILRFYGLLMLVFLISISILVHFIMSVFEVSLDFLLVGEFSLNCFHAFISLSLLSLQVLFDHLMIDNVILMFMELNYLLVNEINSSKYSFICFLVLLIVIFDTTVVSFILTLVSYCFI